MKRLSIFLVTVALTAGMVGCCQPAPPSQNLEIRDWYDLDAIRDNLGGRYILMNDLDSTTPGYSELASPTANQGKGWEPIGTAMGFALFDPWAAHILLDPFSGSFDGQGYEIRDLFVNRPDEWGVGLFGSIDAAGAIENVGVVNVEVTGSGDVGGLVGANHGTVDSSYSTGSVTCNHSYNYNYYVGGLVGYNEGGSVNNSYSASSVTGAFVGGLVGVNNGTIDNCYSSGSVAGLSIGNPAYGGLVGWNPEGTVSNSHYNYNEVLINGQNMITIGALFGEDFDQWLANDKFLDIDERLSQEDGYYLINDVGDFKELLAFGQDSPLKFRLENDLDLGNEANFYIPYLAGEFDGNSHRISNLNLNFFPPFPSAVGLFGFLASGGKVSELAVENVNITYGWISVGGLAGYNDGSVSDSYSTGSVTGNQMVGGLIGWNAGTVGNSYSTSTVSGDNFAYGGLVGFNPGGTVSNSYSTGSVAGGQCVGGLVGVNGGTVSNSHYNYGEVLINGQNIITTGALFDEDFEQWLANDKFLDVNERLSQEDGYYLIDDVGDFKQLLAFGQDDSLKFRLKNDLDLSSEPSLYVPYLAGEFDGNGHKISNLSFNFDFVHNVGLFGYLASGGKVSEVGAENVNITGSWAVGGLMGWNAGTVSNSYSTGSVTGELFNVGGLVGGSTGTVSNSYSTGSVTGYQWVGGLVGVSPEGTVSNSYSTGSVTGHEYVGGLVGRNYDGTVTNSFWDTETSGQATSDDGTGKTTIEMKSIATFSGATWHITAVAAGVTDPTYTWNIVDDETYPFLSWQSVS